MMWYRKLNRTAATYASEEFRLLPPSRREAGTRSFYGGGPGFGFAEHIAAKTHRKARFQNVRHAQNDTWPATKCSG